MKGVMGIFNCDECGGKTHLLSEIHCPHCQQLSQALQIQSTGSRLETGWQTPTLFAACGVAVIWFAVIATSMIWVVSLAHPALLIPVILFLSLIFLVLIYVFGRAFRKQKKTPTDS